MATRVAAAGKQHPGGHLSWGAVKEFADGSLGSRTALMWQPYADDPTTSGLRQVDLGVFGERVKGAAEAGLQVGVHAIGDRAVDEVVQVLQQHTQPCSSSSSSSSTSKKRRCVRHRVEHVQHISGPEAAQQLAGTATAVTNPLHLLPDRAMLEQRLGRERAGAGRSYAYRTLAAAGVVLAHSSDWPIVEMDPLGSVYAAAFRKSLGAQEAAWAGEEQLSVEQALLGHTTGAAVAIGAEGRVGKLAEGMLADFVVLSSSPLLWQGTAADARPQVLQTFLGGRCAHGCLSEGVRKSS
jgi:predicted amidohydrolase YtcJ